MDSLRNPLYSNRCGASPLPVAVTGASSNSRTDALVLGIDNVCGNRCLVLLWGAPLCPTVCCQVFSWMKTPRLFSCALWILRGT